MVVVITIYTLCVLAITLGATEGAYKLFNVFLNCGIFSNMKQNHSVLFIYKNGDLTFMSGSKQGSYDNF